MIKKIGVVGFGGRGGHVAYTGYQSTGGLLRTVACVETSDEKYNYGCEAYQMKPNRYYKVKDMVNNEKIEGVIIATPNQFHLGNLECFTGLDIPILLEKPLDSTFEKICEVVRFAEKYKGPILVGHCMRYAPILRKAKELIDTHAIGKLCSVRFVQNCHYGNIGYHNWRRNKSQSGTWFIEKATHDFDIMFWLIEAKPIKLMAIAKLQAFGGNKPNDLRCSSCKERLSCPESFQNIFDRWGSYSIIEESKGLKNDFCVFAQEVNTPDNETCMMHFDNNTFGTYTETFFTPRSYHHRVYEIIGTEGAMEIDLGVEVGGNITLCSRYGTPDDKICFHFDYLGRNHYNGDSPMTKHFYEVITGKAKPYSTVKQAFIAEVTGYTAIKSAEEDTYLNVVDLIPDDLKCIWNEKV